MAFKWTNLIDGEDYIDVPPINEIGNEVERLNTSKVDKEQGKGLSANDFSDPEKEKLSAIEPNANHYILPEAGTNLGGVKSGGDVLIEDGIIFLNERGFLDERYLPLYKVQGSVALANSSAKANAKNYSVYGESVQNGMATPENPIEFESVGDLVTDENDENYGKYKLETFVTGKNLWNIEEIFLQTSGITKSDDYYTGTAKAFLGVEKRYFKPSEIGKALTLSATMKCEEPCLSFRLATNIDSNMIIIRPADGWKTQSITITPTSTSQYIYFTYGEGSYGNCYIKDIQLEDGEIATDYEPYREYSVSAYLEQPLRKVGNYADYIDYESQKVVRNIYARTLDDSLTYNRFSDTVITTGYATTGRVGKDKAITPIYNSVEPTKNIPTQQNIYFATPSCLSFQINAPYFGFGENYTIDDVKNYFGENPVTVLYVLRTPIEEPVSISPLQLQRGNNYVYATSKIQPSNIEVEYLQDPSLVIEELRNAILSQGGNV